MAADEGWVVADLASDKAEGAFLALQQEVQEARETIDRLTEELRDSAKKQEALVERNSLLVDVTEQQFKLKQRVEDLQSTEKELIEENKNLLEKKEAVALEHKQYLEKIQQDRKSFEEFENDLKAKKLELDNKAAELISLNDRRNRLQNAVSDLEVKQARKKKELAKYNHWFWWSVLVAMAMAVGAPYVWQMFTQDLQHQLVDCQIKAQQQAVNSGVVVVSTDLPKAS